MAVVGKHFERGGVGINVVTGRDYEEREADALGVGSLVFITVCFHGLAARVR